MSITHEAMKDLKTPVFVLWNRSRLNSLSCGALSFPEVSSNGTCKITDRAWYGLWENSDAFHKGWWSESSKGMVVVPAIHWWHIGLLAAIWDPNARSRPPSFWNHFKSPFIPTQAAYQRCPFTTNPSVSRLWKSWTMIVQILSNRSVSLYWSFGNTLRTNLVRNECCLRLVTWSPAGSESGIALSKPRIFCAMLWSTSHVVQQGATCNDVSSPRHDSIITTHVLPFFNPLPSSPWRAKQKVLDHERPGHASPKRICVGCIFL